ncbi:MAG TPA: DUF6328 family protein [Actinocrinis sp.]|jgi:hypothetical protein|uniref:DUF6328 family protein n=1 Tax=Actinocrinis sp. TaxID=1920516 RepID=UPI002D3D091D|nr:DUF6328 family protein [Actinocrinis sp.]HZU56548.1 DUF6328 family protein [Actinocrinis sp.]
MDGARPFGEEAPPGQQASCALRSAKRPETELQRWDRNFTELLQELRVAQTGVQILFGFLLTVPFSNRFSHATTLQVAVYTITVLASAVAAALLIAPVSHHRRVFRQGYKAELVVWADRVAQAGLLALLVAMSGVVFLVLDVLKGIALALPLTIAVVIVYCLLWYLMPNLVYSDTARSSERGD